MLTWRSIQSAHRQAGSVNLLMAPWGFVDQYTFITKSGDVGRVYRLAGIDYEGLDDDQRRQHVHRFESALRLLDPSCRVYQYLCKRRTDSLHGRAVYEVELFLVLLAEDLTPRRRSWRQAFSPSSTLSHLEADVTAAAARLAEQARGFEAQIADAGPLVLPKAEAFAFFRRLVNDTDTGVALKYDTHVDFFMADASVECHRDHLVVGSTRVKVLTMKDAPSATWAVMLHELYALAGSFIVCLEWKRIPVEKARRDINSRRRHFFNRRTSMVNYLSSETPETMLVDDSAAATVTQLGSALTEIEVHGHFFGECSLTFVISGEDADRVAVDASKLLAAHDGSAISETYNLLNAWVGIVPGNQAFNLRRLALLETHAADLSFLFTVDQGRIHDLAGRAPLATLVTQQQTPYRFHLHVQDVGHTLVLGATGSGKTVLMNAIADCAQQYQPQTVIFDLGHGYRALAEQHGGSYLEFGLDTGVAINPFAFDPTPEHLHFLHAFCKVLIEGSDGFRLNDHDAQELYEMVTSIYVLDGPTRRLGTLARMLPKHLAARLRNWTEGERYGRLFDHPVDALSLTPFQVFEFEAIRDYQDLLEPLLFYILHRVNARVRPEVLTLCLMDEAWRFITHPVLREYVQKALKTWRKTNGTMVLATQAVEDFASADLLRTVVESCPTALLLANPSFDRSQYASVFGLNEVELDLLTNLRPRGQVLLKRRGMAKVLDLVLDPRSTWLVAPRGQKKESVHA